MVESGIQFSSFLIQTDVSQSMIHPVLFVHRGKWLLGGGVGKVFLWHIDTGVETQVLHSGQYFNHVPV